MKPRIQLISLLIIFIIPMVLTAQQEIRVFKDSAMISKGKQVGYAVHIPEGDIEEIKKEWSKLIRQNTKSKVEELGLEINIMGTQIEEIHHAPINLYSSIYKTDTVIKLIAFFEIDSVFFIFDATNKTLQSEKNHHAIQHFMRNFAVEQYHNTVAEELDEEEKELKMLNKEFENMQKENENAQKDIEECEQGIINSEHAITTLTTDNERKLEDINIQKESMASIPKDTDLGKEAKKDLKSLEKDKKNIENQLEKERKNIVECTATIDEMNRLIEQNTERIEELELSIDLQEDVVKAVTSKLGGIK